VSEVRRYKHQWIEHGVDHNGQNIEIDMEADVVDAVDHDRVVAEMQKQIDKAVDLCEGYRLAEKLIRETFCNTDSENRKRIERLETALRFYATADIYNYVSAHSPSKAWLDQGETAREALEGEK